MNNFTLADKQALEAFLATGYTCAEVAYNPTWTYPVNPETRAVADGWTQYYREASADLVEVIYTKPLK